ncbi:MAG: hypothetical protein IKP86_14605, partial [Anaerolineaceae bacterium]|nr:hypothetical protein [Anaerolineaceae bacterium]
MKRKKITEIMRPIAFILLLLFSLSVFTAVFAEEGGDPTVITINTGETEPEIRMITVEYSGTEEENRQITVDFSDEWLLQPYQVYNHQLMQASFVLAAAGFRDKTKNLSQKDYNILDFFDKAGFIEPQTFDYDVIPSIDTIGTAIAYKNVGDATLIAVSISGNNYQGEWAGNLTIDDDNRVKGFNDAADKVMDRVTAYISSHDLDGDLRLWTAGYSRSAAVTNDFAADATDSGLFDAVYAYTFATPRTTKDNDGEKYGNIFNLLNPFDMVPMVPFPEWGFHRYGIDLYFPAIETDSGWYSMQKEVSNIYMSVYDDEVILNPQINKNLHTLFDYLAFFISSANSYKKTYQDPLVNFIEAHSFPTLVREITRNINFESIYERIAHSDEIARYQMHEFYGML